MTGFSAAELLARHNIEYKQTRTGKYSTACPDCNGEGYLDVKIDGKGVQWHCQSCKQGDGEYFEQYDERNKPTVDFSNPKAVYDYVDESGARLFQALRFETDTGLKKFSPAHRAGSEAMVDQGRQDRSLSASGTRRGYRARAAPSSSSRAKRTSTTCAAAAFPRPAIRWAPRSGGRSSTRSWPAPTSSFAATMTSPAASMWRSSRATCGPSSSGCACWTSPRYGLRSRKARTSRIGSRRGSRSRGSSRWSTGCRIGRRRQPRRTATTTRRTLKPARTGGAVISLAAKRSRKKPSPAQRAPWLSGAICDDRGRPLAVLANVMLALRGAPEIADALDVRRNDARADPQQRTAARGRRDANDGRGPIRGRFRIPTFSQLQEWLQHARVAQDRARHGAPGRRI